MPEDILKGIPILERLAEECKKRFSDNFLLRNENN